MGKINRPKTAYQYYKKNNKSSNKEEWKKQTPAEKKKYQNIETSARATYLQQIDQLVKSLQPLDVKAVGNATVCDVHKKCIGCSVDEWEQQTDNLYIGRHIQFTNITPSKWKNPFKAKTIGLHNSLILYREWVKTGVNLITMKKRPQGPLLKDIHELSHKNIGCWCRDKNNIRTNDNLCHGDVLNSFLTKVSISSGVESNPSTQHSANDLTIDQTSVRYFNLVKQCGYRLVLRNGVFNLELVINKNSDSLDLHELELLDQQFKQLGKNMDRYTTLLRYKLCQDYKIVPNLGSRSRPTPAHIHIHRPIPDQKHKFKITLTEPEKSVQETNQDIQHFFTHGDVRVLSVRQPWAWAIVNGYKTIENRSTPFPSTLPIPSWIVIHASKTKYPAVTWEKELSSLKLALEFSGIHSIQIPNRNEFRYGQIVGLAKIVQAGPKPRDIENYWWSMDKHAYDIGASARYTGTIRSKGQLGFGKMVKQPTVLSTLVHAAKVDSKDPKSDEKKLELGLKRHDLG